MMYILYNENVDPYWNLAAEEHLLRAYNDDFFMLWRNEPSIIIGRHQNANAEINIPYVKEKGIKVVRRISGGGAVFHDLGNINFTFIQGGDDPKTIDFEKYTKPIVDALQKLGVSARLEGRNDLSIDGKKISGNAEHILKKRILHHGTLLFSAKMTDLSTALKVNLDKYRDKAVKSIRKRVTNISENLKDPMTVEQFIQYLISQMKEQYPNSLNFTFNDQDLNHINKMVEEKYHTWDWNFGRSPDYNFKQSGRTNGGTIEVNMDVHHGIIEKVKIYGDFFSMRDLSEFENKLEKTPHTLDDIKAKFDQINFDEYFSNIKPDELLKLMF